LDAGRDDDFKAATDSKAAPEDGLRVVRNSGLVPGGSQSDLPPSLFFDWQLVSFDLFLMNELVYIPQFVWAVNNGHDVPPIRTPEEVHVSICGCCLPVLKASKLVPLMTTNRLQHGIKAICFSRFKRRTCDVPVMVVFNLLPAHGTDRHCFGKQASHSLGDVRYSMRGLATKWLEKTFRLFDQIHDIRLGCILRRLLTRMLTYPASLG